MVVETRSMKKKELSEYEKMCKSIDKINEYLEECRIKREKEHGNKPRIYCIKCSRDITFTHCGYDTCDYCYETEFSVY